MPVTFVNDPSKAKEIIHRVLLSERRPFIVDHVTEHLSGIVRKTVAQIALDELENEKRVETRMVGEMKTYYGLEKIADNSDDDDVNLATLAKREAFMKRVAADGKKPCIITSRRGRVRQPPRQKVKRALPAKTEVQKRRQLVDQICGTAMYPDDDDEENDACCATSTSSSSS